MSYQPCDEEGKPLSGTEPKEMWRVPDVPLKDKYQFTYFSHKGELSKVNKEKNSLEARQIKERKSREANGDTFTPKWFDLTNEVVTTPYGETPIYKYNYKYNEHGAKVNSLIEVVQPIEFNPWQYGQEKMA
ncbi:oxysterol-binding protein-related protein 3C-like [Papaver somniferum]|uniref:oxysterol-binding protein-related protein 3C-like n=1 Tax=Papaver somniferum TaxID=3469 RepID=UPI000E6F826C|nr:oxysterol-binding protein-related protein 3C-like [Papaver somniferum]